MKGIKIPVPAASFHAVGIVDQEAVFIIAIENDKVPAGGKIRRAWHR